MVSVTCSRASQVSLQQLPSALFVLDVAITMGFCKASRVGHMSWQGQSTLQEVFRRVSACTGSSMHKRACVGAAGLPGVRTQEQPKQVRACRSSGLKRGGRPYLDVVAHGLVRPQVKPVSREHRLVASRHEQPWEEAGYAELRCCVLRGERVREVVQPICSAHTGRPGTQEQLNRCQLG